MKKIRAGVAVLNQTPLDWKGNAAHIREAIAQAREERISVLCLPELCITGYGCEDMFLAPGVSHKAAEVLRDLLPETKGMVVSFGLPLFYRSCVFDAAALAVDGKLIGFAVKRHLAGDGLHYETRWFKAWQAGVVDVIEFDGADYPIGDVVFDVDGVRFGFEICEDAWVANRPGAELNRMGVDLILNPSASHFAFGKHRIRCRFVLEGSRSYHATYLYANLLGNEAGRAIYDGDALIASGGRLIACGPRFSYRAALVTSAVIDVERTRLLRACTVSHSPRLDDREFGYRVVRARAAAPEFSFPEVESAVTATVEVEPEVDDMPKEVEFARAVPLALFDYLRKSRSQGFVISLSGGADSGAVACLVSLMLDLAVGEIGEDGVRAKLGYIKFPDKVTKWPSALLSCVYQATRNSTDVTRDAARDLATALGADYQDWDIDELVQGYRAIVEKGLGRELAWETDDLALQNIQARVRSPGIWMLANIRGALLLSTSNRSEAAVGYATMDGDTSGGLSPIAGIDKAFLRHWLRWLEKNASPAFGIHPVPALAAINDQQPTAELRPPDRRQTDEADLMPYPVLDAIERAAIRDKKMPAEVLETIRHQFPDFGLDHLTLWVRRFFRLWSRNQWKRERYAPSFHLDDENLDPKTWCRFPILSGGFEEELEGLD